VSSFEVQPWAAIVPLRPESYQGQEAPAVMKPHQLGERRLQAEASHA
jgi:hypothetical protein